MKNIFIATAIVSGIVLGAACTKEASPAQYEKENITPVLEGVSADNLFWECDGLETYRIDLDGEGLVPEAVTSVTDAENSAFYIDVNGDIILVSPKSVNTDPQTDIEETLSISVTGSETFSVSLKQSRMNKPMLLTVEPGELNWNHDQTDTRSVTVSGLNIDGVKLTVTSDTENSGFSWSVSGLTVDVTPESTNTSPDAARSETLTISAEGGNSISFKVNQARMPSEPEILYSTTFENTDKPEANLPSYTFSDVPATYTCDGKQWTMTYADVTSQYVWTSKTSHILARVANGSDQQAVICSDNLLSDVNTITTFSVTLARRNNNEGWCRVEYSTDGTTWSAAGDDFQAMLSGSAAEEYEFSGPTGDTDTFMIRVTYYFKETPSAHAFLNFEGVKIMGY